MKKKKLYSKTSASHLMRIQKYLSQAGVTSRRKAEALILQGRVKVNGKVVKTLGTKIHPGQSKVEVDGKTIYWHPKRIYILLNKPKGYLTALSDPSDRPLVVDLLPKKLPRVYPVGRLDWDSEGLLIFTNDGDFAHALTHPSQKLIRVYEAKVKGNLSEDSPAFKKLKRGLELDDGWIKPDRLRHLSFTGKHTWIEVHIHEGRNRLIRRMCEAIGHPVLKLKRIQWGPLTLEGLPTGQIRDLKTQEIRELWKATGLSQPLKQK